MSKAKPKAVSSVGGEAPAFDRSREGVVRLVALTLLAELRIPPRVDHD